MPENSPKKSQKGRTNLPVNSDALLERAADLLRAATYAVALTGAGISTPSGIPDFRSSEGGLWTKYDPMEVASLTAFRLDPERFYRWFRPLAHTIVEAQPNPAHVALAHLEDLGRLKAVITQNIDGLHQRAGSETVFEVHGSVNTLTCVDCYHKYGAKDFLPQYIYDGVTPRCRLCEGILKSDAILFEEQLPYQTWQAVEKVVRECDLMLVVGSSLEVMPVAGLPVKALNRGARLIVINHTPTYVDVRADVVVCDDVAETLPRIVEHVTD